MFSSCGYKLSYSQGEPYKRYSVMYQGCFEDPSLTYAIVKNLSENSRWLFDKNSPEYLLVIEQIDQQSAPIGYKYDIKEKTQMPINRLIPIEGRKNVKIFCNLLKNNEEKSSIKKFSIEAASDYDFVNFDNFRDLSFIDKQGVPQTVLQYSLGQLDSSDGAQAAAIKASYLKIGRKISDILQKL